MKRIRLMGQETHYVLKRSNRKSVGLRITSEGLSVNAPHRMPEHALEALLGEKAEWILKKLEEAKTSCSQKWADGEPAPFLGKNYLLRIGCAQTLRVRVSDDFIDVHLPHPSPDNIEAAMRAWYRRQALVRFSERVRHYCEVLALNEPRLFLSNARTRWGSCNTKREVRLNWRLVKLPLELVDYVVVHELSHLVEMNHSQAFWDTVGRAYPAYRRARQELRRIRLW